jgi:NitT/TauT family transport system permease protein
MSPAATRRLAPWVATLGLVVLWEAACRLFALPEFILPTPSASLVALVQNLAAIWHNASFTLWVTLLGFAIAVVFGLALGVVIGASALMYAALYPLLIGFNSIPKVAIVPILVIWFGIGAVPAVLTAFLISFFPIVVNVATGLATLEPELRDVLRSLGARPLDILLKVGLPRAMPYFFASLKVAVTLAFVGSVISETIAGNRGIGYLMLSASSSFRVPLVFAGLIVVAIMGVGMYAVFAVLERRFAGWAFRSEVGGCRRTPPGPPHVPGPAPAGG